MKRLLLLALLTVVGCGSSQSPVTLTFAPPDSVQFTGEIITSRTQSAGDRSASDTTITFSTHILTNRDGQARMITRADSVLKGTAGPRANDLINQLLVQTEFVQTFDGSGQAVSMTGYEDLFQRMEASLPPEQARAMRMATNPALLSKRELGQWNSTVGKFASLGAMTPGQLAYDTAVVELPSGAPLVYYRSIRLLDTRDDNSKTCARIELLSHTDPRLLATLLNLPVADVLAQFPGYDSTATAFGNQQVNSQDKSEWLIEVATLLVHQHVSEQTIDVTLPTAQGQMVNTHVVQNEVKRFRY
jgi:hypothetical protein